jgi:hypothetical protein
MIQVKAEIPKEEITSIPTENNEIDVFKIGNVMYEKYLAIANKIASFKIEYIF